MSESWTPDADAIRDLWGEGWEHSAWSYRNDIGAIEFVREEPGSLGGVMRDSFTVPPCDIKTMRRDLEEAKQ